MDRPKPKRRHYLPIYTNAFDRVFISIVVLVALHLLWMRFLEAYLPLEIATIIALVLGVLIIRYG
jgi:predicted small integral membrane protein